MLESLFQRHQWSVVNKQSLPGRPADVCDPSDIPLRQAAHQLLSRYPNGIYRHQSLALKAFARGQNICVATGTASGKSLVFYAAAAEQLADDRQARILAIYPLKALAREQQQRWQHELDAAGLTATIGRIDGGIKDMKQREQILRDSRVVLMTPDILHAWLLSHLSSPKVREFLASLRLVIVDEVHVYTGVFGSNAAYLFRRLQHAAATLAGATRLRFVAASATVADPDTHLQELFGCPFTVIRPEDDSSARYERELYLVRPPGDRALYTAISELLNGLVHESSARFIAFVDSRRQTEQLATILARGRHSEVEDDGAAATAERALERLHVLPYRSGYEEKDREVIQARLNRGTLRGIISTSALELGLDIQGLDTVVLVGMPQTATGLHQRIGRVGRHGPGTIILIDTGSVADGVVFRNPNRVFDRPLLPAVLHLENRRIQYIHALCFAGRGAEYDTLAGHAGDAETDAELKTVTAWPAGFLDLCRMERNGQVPVDLQSMKAEAGDDPWHTFPLRDVGSQYQVEQRTGDLAQLGSLSAAQLIREAYPGAIYYYLTEPYRVIRVLGREKKVLVRREKYYRTDPSGPPVQVAPQLSAGLVHRAIRFGELRLVECDMYISESVTGYTETRGGTKLPTVKYPCEYWHLTRFGRNYTSTGVILSHPSLSRPGVQLKLLADVLLEAFLLVAPFERSEVNSTTGRHWAAQLGFARGEPFLTVYDQTYGSLRLTGRLMERDTLQNVLGEAQQIIAGGRLEMQEAPAPATLAALAELLEAGRLTSEPLIAQNSARAAASEGELVIVPGSMGWIVTANNQEFLVERVFYHPKDGLRYYGRRVGAEAPENLQTWFPAANIHPIPGVSRMGRYDYDTGEVSPDDVT